MSSYFSTQAIRQLEQFVFEELSISERELMQRAGRAAFDVLQQEFPEADYITVLCGPGNNGGDGYVLALEAFLAGKQVTVLQISETAKAGAAYDAQQACLRAGVDIQKWSGDIPCKTDVIIDGLFGFGLEREIEGELTRLIRQVNASKRPVLALDIPSGIHANSGASLGIAVHARHTVTFIAAKSGCATGEGLAACGQLHIADLGLPTELVAKQTPVAQSLDLTALSTLLPLRSADAHKSMFGHVLIIGGAKGMPGAVRLAGEAALRLGAGLVSLATHPAHASVIPLSRPELMVHGVEVAEELESLIEKASVLLVGPGTSEDNWSQTMIAAALQSDKPRVIDAGALHYLGSHPQQADNWVLTPHPGEAASLLANETQAIQSNRYDAARHLQAEYHGVIVLKGAGTLVQSEACDVCPVAHAVLATAGMGDVLGGMIAALMAQGLPTRQAARLGVSMHAEAACQAAGSKTRGLLASDLFSFLSFLSR